MTQFFLVCIKPQRLCTLHAPSKRLIQVYCLPYLCFFLKIFSSVLNIYPVLLFLFLEDVSEIAVCPRSAK